MGKPTEAHVEAARRLLAQEGERVGVGEGPSMAAGSAYERLFSSLTPIIGMAGFGALFERSIKLSIDEFPGLAELTETSVPPRTARQTRELLVGCLLTIEPKAAAAAATAVFASLFRLLIGFIGDDLVRQILIGESRTAADVKTKETE